MTVRLTPSESDSSPSAPVAAPLDLTGPPVTAPGPAPLTSDPDGARPTDPSTDVPQPTATGTHGGGSVVTDPVIADPMVSDPSEVDPVVTAPDGAEPIASGSDGVHATPGSPGAVTADSRVALREARRVRRRTAWLCAAVVALALALTITVVSLARTRPIPQSSGPVGSTATALVLVPSVPNPGATAPEGGTP